MKNFPKNKKQNYEKNEKNKKQTSMFLKTDDYV